MFPQFSPSRGSEAAQAGNSTPMVGKGRSTTVPLCSRFFNRFPVALPLRCFHLEEVSSVTAELARAERSEGIAEGEA